MFSLQFLQVLLQRKFLRKEKKKVIQVISFLSFLYRHFQQWKVSQEVHPHESKKERECSKYNFCQQKRERSKCILKDLYCKFSS